MRMIVAESDKLVRQELTSYLERFPFNVLKTGDLPSLKVLLQQDIDLLILDLSLVFGQEASFFSQLKSTHPALPILIMKSGNNSIPFAHTDNLFYLDKPFAESDFGSILESILAQSRHKETATPLPLGKHLDIELLPSARKHPAMQKAIRLLESVADSDMTVLLHGESGVGKEIFSKRLHNLSKRQSKNFVALNCAAIPSNLLEAELFGSERGSYTGSVGRHIGKFEMASKGTLLLDEISEMDLSLQAKLLRVIQEKEVYRVGGNEPIQLDVRLIATTNKDLKEMVRQGRFREDLFYRLNVISVYIPPLRERLEDIPLLARHMVQRASETQGRSFELAQTAMDSLLKYSWPGNLRELENILLRSSCLTKGRQITKVHFDEMESAPVSRMEESTEAPVGSIRDVEKKMIMKALQLSNGNRERAAKNLGISNRTLRNKLKLYREEDTEISGSSSVDFPVTAFAAKSLS